MNRTTRLHSKLYNYQALQKVIKLYGDYVKTTMNKSGDYYEVEFHDIPQDFQDDVVEEFNNYVLGETIEALKPKDEF